MQPLALDIQTDGQVLARQVVGQRLAVGGFEPEGFQTPRQRLAGDADQLPLLRRRIGIDHRPGGFQHLYLAARLNPALVQCHQILAEIDIPILATPVTGEGSQRLLQGIEAIRARFHRGHDAAAAGLGHTELHLADADAHPAVLLERPGTGCHQVGTELAHLVQGIGAQVEVIERALADQQQGITVGEADPGAGFFPETIRLLAEPKQGDRLTRDLAQPEIGADIGMQGGEAVAPDAGSPRCAGKILFSQRERFKSRIAQLQAALYGGRHYLL